MNLPSATVERRKSAAEASAKRAGRYYDPSFDAMAVKVLPGEHYVSRAPDEMIVTVLGSCVAACVRDPGIGVGGMNHFMLPHSDEGLWGNASASLRFGNFAMERLFNDIFELGGRRRHLEIKVFGGANVLGNGGTIGHQNSAFIEEYLKAEGLPIVARDLYGLHPRRLHYFPVTGAVAMLELRRQSDLGIVAEEKVYQKAIDKAPVAGAIELFDD